jgi:60 kDa SS-A/Ro ribonucleoprotein
MARFSHLVPKARESAVPDSVNFAGGRAFAPDAKFELVSVLLTTFLEDEFYRTGRQTTARIRELIRTVADPRFTAKAALYARHVHGMRSVSHLVAGELARSVKGATWSKGFYDRLVRRPDDVMETLGYYLAVHGRPAAELPEEGTRRGVDALRRTPAGEIPARARSVQAGGRRQPRPPTRHARALQARAWRTRAPRKRGRRG